MVRTILFYLALTGLSFMAHSHVEAPHKHQAHTKQARIAVLF